MNTNQQNIEKNLYNDTNTSFTKTAFFTVIAVPFIFMLNLQYGQTLLPALQGDSYDMRRVFQLIMILIVGLSLAYHTKWRNQCIIQFTMLSKVSKYCIYGFFILGLVSSSLVSYGVNYQALPEQAFLQVGIYISFFLSAMLVSQWTQNSPEKFEYWVIFMLHLMIGLYLIMVSFHIINYHISMPGAADTATSFESSNVRQSIMSPFFANIRFLSQFMTWTWPLLVLPLISKNDLSKSTKTILFVIILCWFAQTFMLQGRSNMLEFVIVPAIILVMFRKKSLPWLKWQLLGLIAGFILWYIIYMHVLDGDYRSVAITAKTGRWFIYLSSLKTALAHPLLGTGPMHLSITLLPMGGERLGWVATPHNALLKIVAEWGIPAFTLCCIIACKALYQWAKLSITQINSENISDEQHNKNALFICLSASILSGLMHSMLSGVTTMPLSQTTMVLVFGWAWGLYQLNTNNKDHIQLLRTQNKINPIKHLFFILLLIYTTLLITKGIFPRLYYLTWANTISNFTTGGMLAPRFWAQGVLQLFPLVHYY